MTPSALPWPQIQNLGQWVVTTAAQLPQRSYEQACGIWTGEDFVPILQQMGVTPLTFCILHVRESPHYTVHSGNFISQLAPHPHPPATP